MMIVPIGLGKFNAVCCFREPETREHRFETIATATSSSAAVHVALNNEYRSSRFLFSGKRPDMPYADTPIQKAIKRSAQLAGIRKRVHPHALRHSYATGLLEAGVDLLTISRLLGHASFVTTMVYLHCRRENLGSIPSPLDWLPVQQLPTYQNVGSAV